MDKEFTPKDAELQHLEEELQEYKKFFDETPVAFMRTDLRTGKFLLANNYCATLLGYDSIEELIKNERDNTMYSKEDRQRLIQRIKKEGSVEGYEIKLHLKSGKTVWVSAWLHVNCGGSCLEGTLIDITFQKEAEFELLSIKNKQLKSMKGLKEKLETIVSNFSI